MVVKTTEIVFSKTEDQIIASDIIFNQNFKIEHVRQHDLLLLSSIELDLGKVKNLKEKVKTIEDLQKLSNLRHVTLALVVEGLQQTSYDKSDSNEHILIEVNLEKMDFIENQLDTALARFYVYHITDLSQDFKQYDAVLQSEKL